MLGKFPELALLVRARDRATLRGGGHFSAVPLCHFLGTEVPPRPRLCQRTPDRSLEGSGCAWPLPLNKQLSGQGRVIWHLGRMPPLPSPAPLVVQMVTCGCSDASPRDPSSASSTSVSSMAEGSFPSLRSSAQVSCSPSKPQA